MCHLVRSLPPPPAPVPVYFFCAPPPCHPFSGSQEFTYTLPVLCPKQVKLPTVATRLVTAVACSEKATAVFARTYTLLASELEWCHASLALSSAHASACVGGPCVLRPAVVLNAVQPASGFCDGGKRMMLTGFGIHSLAWIRRIGRASGGSGCVEAVCARSCRRRFGEGLGSCFGCFV
jgi:hypothetical protein